MFWVRCGQVRVNWSMGTGSGMLGWHTSLMPKDKASERAVRAILSNTICPVLAFPVKLQKYKFNCRLSTFSGFNCLTQWEPVALLWRFNRLGNSHFLSICQPSKCSMQISVHLLFSPNYYRMNHHSSPRTGVYNYWWEAKHASKGGATWRAVPRLCLQEEVETW